MTEGMELLFELFSDLPRQGPGSAEATLRALGMIQDLPTRPGILDVGCGTGAQTMVLAEHTDGRITALDLHPPYLAELAAKARKRGVEDRITTVAGDMSAMALPEESFDLVWSEGAIYIIGFARGLREWRRLLRSGGHLAVTEVVWLVEKPARELREFWDAEYPAIGPVEDRLAEIRESGYRAVGHFVLPPEVWWDDFYRPLEASLEAFLARHPGEPEAEGLIDATRVEIDMFRRYGDQYGYAFLIMQMG